MSSGSAYTTFQATGKLTTTRNLRDRGLVKKMN